MKTKSIVLVFAAVVSTVAAMRTLGCGSARSARSLAAEKVYVPPGEQDKYYAFLSGGQSGSVFVVGIPSCRIIREIPIFEPRAGLGYANNPNSESYKRLAATRPIWGDTHHPV